MNCTACVKILYDYDVLDSVRSYRQNLNLYGVTGNHKFYEEAIEIENNLSMFFDIGHFELNMLNSEQYLSAYFNNKRKTRERLVDKINYYLSKVDDLHSVYFVTLTFNDAFLVGREYFKIRRKVREFVKLFSDYFILNKDYGDTNFRLHFHGVIVFNNLALYDFKQLYEREFGFCDLKCCNTRTDLISAYIEKLSFHALKTSTKKEYREHIIHSRMPLYDAEVYKNKNKELIMKLDKEQKFAINEVRKELFKEYSAYEYKCAIKYLVKHRLEYHSQEDVNNALYEYLKTHHEKNKCWKNKL